MNSINERVIKAKKLTSEEVWRLRASKTKFIFALLVYFLHCSLTY